MFLELDVPEKWGIPLKTHVKELSYKSYKRVTKVG